jgi:hypothetical protein
MQSQIEAISSPSQVTLRVASARCVRLSAVFRPDGGRFRRGVRADAALRYRLIVAEVSAKIFTRPSNFDAHVKNPSTVKIPKAVKFIALMSAALYSAQHEQLQTLD